MNRILISFLAFEFFWMIEVSPTLPALVDKNSVILHEVNQLENFDGHVYAEESIYLGGIGYSGNVPAQTHPSGKVVLRELRSTQGSFHLKKESARIEVKIIPMVGTRDDKGAWKVAAGRWEFQSGENPGYENVIHVHKGGDLNIAYQSTGLRLGEKGNVLHYGLSGNPHAISLSRKRFQEANDSHDSPFSVRPILTYQPPQDMILVILESTKEGPLFKPIVNYQVQTP